MDVRLLDPNTLESATCVIADCNASNRSNTYLAIDTETGGDDPHRDLLKLIQFGGYQTPIYLVQTSEFAGRLTDLEALFQTNVVKILQNGKFDLMFLAANGIEVTGPFFDTMLASQVLTCGQEIRNDLGSLAQRHLGRTIDKSLQKSFLDNTPLTPEQMSYGADDVDVLAPLKLALQAQLVTQGLSHVAALEFEVMPILSRIERVGVGVDPDKLTRYHEGLQGNVQEFSQQAQAQLSTEVSTSLFSGEIEQGQINLNSPRAILKALMALGIEPGSSQTNTLVPLADKHPGIAALLKYRRAVKTLRVFEKKLLPMVNPHTQRIHGEYVQCKRDGTIGGSRTGLEQLQALDFLRPCPNHHLICIRYEDLAMRVLAHVSGCQYLSLFYQDNKSFEESTQHAVAIGAGVQGLKGVRLQQFAYDEWGVLLSGKESRDLAKDFFKEFPGIADYHKQLRNHRSKRASNLLGRTCQWQFAPSVPSLCQFMVHSTVSDILKQALCKPSSLLDYPYGDIVLVLDCQIILEVSELSIDRLDEMCRQLQHSVESILEETPVKVQWKQV